MNKIQKNTIKVYTDDNLPLETNFKRMNELGFSRVGSIKKNDPCFTVNLKQKIYFMVNTWDYKEWVDEDGCIHLDKSQKIHKDYEVDFFSINEFQKWLEQQNSNE